MMPKILFRSVASCLVAAACAIASPGCIEASQKPLDYEAVAVTRGNGTAVTGKWTVTLTRAEVALGPFYFCAAASGSSTLCESSISEVASVAFVDALSSGPTPMGKVRGFSGPIRSVSYDFGISWLETQAEATPAPPLPRGHSMRLEGFARSRDLTQISFVADIDLVPQYQGQNAVSTAPATADVQSERTRLEVVLEPAAWFTQVDFDALEAARRFSLVITPGTAEHGAILVGVKNLAPIELRWVSSP